MGNKEYKEAAELLDLEFIEGVIQPGDLYLAGRNVSVQLYTCKSIHPRRWIVSTEKFAYPYDTWECRKVQEKQDA